MARYKNDVYYDIVCLICDNIVSCQPIDGYPLEWQSMVCQQCGGVATPSLEHPRYVTENEARLIQENGELKRKLSAIQDREAARGLALEWVSPIPSRLHGGK